MIWPEEYAFYLFAAKMTYAESSTASRINLMAAAANTFFFLRKSYLDFVGKIIKLG